MAPPTFIHLSNKRSLNIRNVAHIDWETIHGKLRKKGILIHFNFSSGLAAGDTLFLEENSEEAEGLRRQLNHPTYAEQKKLELRQTV